MGEFMGVAVLYARISTGGQEKRNFANLPTQQKKCREWCIHEGHSVLRIFVDKESARTEPRFSARDVVVLPAAARQKHWQTAGRGRIVEMRLIDAMERDA